MPVGRRGGAGDARNQGSLVLTPLGAPTNKKFVQQSTPIPSRPLNNRTRPLHNSIGPGRPGTSSRPPVRINTNTNPNPISAPKPVPAPSPLPGPSKPLATPTSNSASTSLPKPEKVRNRKQKKLLSGLYVPCFTPLSHMRNLSKYQNSLKNERNQISKNEKSKLDTSISNMNEMKLNLSLVNETSVGQAIGVSGSGPGTAVNSKPVKNKIYLDLEDKGYDFKKLIFNDFEACKLDKNVIMPRLLHPEIKLVSKLNNHQRKNLITKHEIDSLNNGENRLGSVSYQTPTTAATSPDSPPHSLQQALQAAINFRKNNLKTSIPDSIETVIPKSTFAPLTHVTHDDVKHLTVADKSKKVIQILSSYCSKVDLERLGKKSSKDKEVQKEETKSSKVRDQRREKTEAVGLGGENGQICRF